MVLSDTIVPFRLPRRVAGCTCVICERAGYTAERLALLDNVPSPFHPYKLVRVEVVPKGGAALAVTSTPAAAATVSSPAAAVAAAATPATAANGSTEDVEMTSANDGTAAPTSTTETSSTSEPHAADASSSTTATTIAPASSTAAVVPSSTPALTTTASTSWSKKKAAAAADSGEAGRVVKYDWEMTVHDYQHVSTTMPEHALYDAAPSQQVWVRALLQVVQRLMREKRAAAFLHPVDPVALNLPDYPTIIRHPMDLSTIEKKLTTSDPEQFPYRHPDEVVSDVRLIFVNCLTYNKPDHALTKIAGELSRKFESWVINTSA